MDKGKYRDEKMEMAAGAKKGKRTRYKDRDNGKTVTRTQRRPR
jgi:hypothetical protein